MPPMPHPLSPTMARPPPSAALGAAAAAVDSAPRAAMRHSCSAWILSSSHTLPVASRLTPSMSAGSAAPMVAQADALVQAGRAEGVRTVAGPRGRVHVVAVRAAARRLVLHDPLLLLQPLDAEDDGADHAHLVKDVADELALAGVDHLRLVVARQAAQHAAARVLQRANLAKKGREVELLQQETGGGAAQGEEEGEAEGQDPPFAATASAVPHPAVEALVRGEPSSMRNAR